MQIDQPVQALLFLFHWNRKWNTCCLAVPRRRGGTERDRKRDRAAAFVSDAGVRSALLHEREH